jgi:hypothetical protein
VAAVAMASAMAAVVLEVLGRWGQKREKRSRLYVCLTFQCLF